MCTSALDRPRLTGENQPVREIFGLEDVARRHVDLTGDHGGHARTAAAFPAGVGHVDARVEQHVDQTFGVRGQRRPMPLTVEIDLDVCDF